MTTSSDSLREKVATPADRVGAFLDEATEYSGGISLSYARDELSFGDLRALLAERDALLAVRDELVEAARPFDIDWINHRVLSDPLVIDLHVQGTSFKTQVTVGQFRALSAALTKASAPASRELPADLLRPSQECLDEIRRLEEQQAVAAHQVRNMLVGSPEASAPIPGDEGGE